MLSTNGTSAEISPRSDSAESDIDFTGFHVPRRAMGLQAVELLEAILSGTATERQLLLPCELTDGTTLTPPSKGV